MVDNTIATMTCKPYFKEVDGQKTTQTVCMDGTWDQPLKKCEPVCGDVVSKVTPLIVNGVAARYGDFPWHVAIYRKKEEFPIPKFICGGSIISVNKILSAAHCFTSDKVRHPASEFHVGAGKYFSSYNEENDVYAQLLKVKKIEIPSKYNGFELDYLGDISIIVVEKHFILSNAVRPVCIDWKNTEDFIEYAAPGHIVGWGSKNETQSVKSDELRQLTVPYISNEECYGRLPTHFLNFLRDDKICAGFNNGSSVCVGDSGGGLVFKNPEDNKYYIRGIVSLAPTLREQNKVCDNFHVALYTAVSKYINNFINPIEISNRQAYDLSKNIDGTCTPLMSPNLDVSCSINGIKTNCNKREEMVQNTIATMVCKPYYKEVDGQQITRTVCKDGTWDKSIKECELECGEIVSESTSLNVNGVKTNVGNFPWHVSIYRKQKTDPIPIYKCGGSIISSNVILSAAQCFTSNNAIHPASEYYVAAGKYHIEYNSKDDVYAQLLKVKEIKIQEAYLNSESGNLADIAVVILNNQFTVSDVIRPVCVDWDDTKNYIFQEGNVVGWVSTNETQDESKNLIQLPVPFIDYDECNNILPNSALPYFKNDKYCAGNNNGTKFCFGDIGGGLIFQNPIDHKYYIRGIASLVPAIPDKKNVCNDFQIGLYTIVSTYVDIFIKPIVIKNRIR